MLHTDVCVQPNIRVAVTVCACTWLARPGGALVQASDFRDSDALGDARPLQPSLQPPHPDTAAPPVTEAFSVRVVFEGGFIATFSNFGAFGQDASRIDFKEAAGQKNLSSYSRWAAEFDLGRRHTLVFLYQPLSTDGIRTPTTDERYENVTFRGGVPVRTEFRFPFYRLSYLYKLAYGDSGDFAVGLTGQIRNADYRYTSVDGMAFAQSSDVGFVPALKMRGEIAARSGAFVGFEADGIYAPISVLNGSTNDTVGAILDASLRIGVRLGGRGNAFVVLRYLGGGATNEDPANYAKNWLHIGFVGVGASFDLFATRRASRLH